jgi:hypothetical protein
MPDDFYEEIRLKLTAAEIAIDVLALFHVVGAVRLLGAMIDMPNALTHATFEITAEAQDAFLLSFGPFLLRFPQKATIGQWLENTQSQSAYIKSIR